MQNIILGLLRHGEARHGYAIVKEYRDRTGFRISVGHVYRELQRLLSNELVRTATNPPGADPRRLPYVITPAGAAAFEAWLAGHSSVVQTECHDELAVRAFFLSAGTPASAKSTLDLWREELSVHRQVCERAREVAALPHELQSSPMLALLLGRRLQYITADIAFVDALRSTVEREQERRAPSAVPQRPRTPMALGKRRSVGYPAR